MPIHLTEAAANAVKDYIQKQTELEPGKVRLRVGVKGGGCSGFNYLLDLTETDDESFERFNEHGVEIICDPKSYLYLNGTVIDYRNEVMGSGFAFNNPNSTSTCGCGSSFSA
jgi:iron-sulfur cluster assembly protein